MIVLSVDTRLSTYVKCSDYDFDTWPYNLFSSNFHSISCPRSLKNITHLPFVPRKIKLKLADTIIPTLRQKYPAFRYLFIMYITRYYMEGYPILLASLAPLLNAYSNLEYRADYPWCCLLFHLHSISLQLRGYTSCMLPYQFYYCSIVLEYCLWGYILFPASYLIGPGIRHFHFFPLFSCLALQYHPWFLSHFSLISHSKFQHPLQYPNIPRPTLIFLIHIPYFRNIHRWIDQLLPQLHQSIPVYLDCFQTTSFVHGGISQSLVVTRDNKWISWGVIYLENKANNNP